MKTKVIISLIIIVVLLATGIGVYVYLVHKNSPTLTTSSTLANVIDKYDLETVDYKYNSIATMKDGDKDMYYVRYDGDVKLGVDLNEVTFDVNQRNKTITVNVPKATVQTIQVNPVDFIFVKEKYETDTVIVDARQLCKSDLEGKVSSNTELYDRAWNNATGMIDGIIKPLSEGYKVKYEVNGGGSQ